MNRKDFLKFSVLAVAGAAIAGSGFLQGCNQSLSTPQGPDVDFTLDLNDLANSALGNAGGSVYAYGVIVVRVDVSTYVAVSQVCTHNGCTLAYNTTSKKFVCPCHQGTFDLSGNVYSGPPPSPIKNYTVLKTGNILSVKG